MNRYGGRPPLFGEHITPQRWTPTAWAGASARVTARRYMLAVRRSKLEQARNRRDTRPALGR